MSKYEPEEVGEIDWDKLAKDTERVHRERREILDKLYKQYPELLEDGEETN